MKFFKEIAKFLLLSVIVSALNLQVFAPKALAFDEIEIRSVQNIDRTYCREVKRIFIDERRWTSDYGSTQLPTACYMNYYNQAWQEIYTPDYNKCLEVRAAWNAVPWTSTYSKMDMPRMCVERYFRGSLNYDVKFQFADGNRVNDHYVQISSNQLNLSVCNTGNDDFYPTSYNTFDVLYNYNYNNSNFPGSQTFSIEIPAGQCRIVTSQYPGYMASGFVVKAKIMSNYGISMERTFDFGNLNPVDSNFVIRSIENIDLSYCREVKNEFLSGRNWTSRYGQPTLPGECKRRYFDAGWNERVVVNTNFVVKSNQEIDASYCREVKNEFLSGRDWTTRYGRPTLPGKCKQLYYDAGWNEQSTSNYNYCSRLIGIYNDANHWTNTYGSAQNLMQCHGRYPSIQYLSEPYLKINDVKFSSLIGSSKDVLSIKVCNSNDKEFNTDFDQVKFQYTLNGRTYRDSVARIIPGKQCKFVETKLMNLSLNGNYAMQFKLTNQRFADNFSTFNKNLLIVTYDQFSETPEVTTQPNDNFERLIEVDSPFTDLNTEDGLIFEAAKYLNEEGIIGGYPDGTFRKDRLVNRAEAAKFILLSKYGSVRNISNNNVFSDVENGSWYERYVMDAQARGILQGYADGTFRPANTVNTVEFLKILSNTFSLEQDLPHNFTDVLANSWYERYVGVVSVYNLFPGRTQFLKPASSLTREDVAIALYRILTRD